MQKKTIAETLENNTNIFFLNKREIERNNHIDADEQDEDFDLFGVSID